MNKKQEKEIKDKLQEHMGEFLQWVYENYPQDYTPECIEHRMAEIAYLVLSIAWSSYSQGAEENM